MLFFFFNDTATTEIYTLSLHDALPIYRVRLRLRLGGGGGLPADLRGGGRPGAPEALATARHRRFRPLHHARSEEHTSELQSQSNLVCRLLLEKKKKKKRTQQHWKHKTV